MLCLLCHLVLPHVCQMAPGQPSSGLLEGAHPLGTIKVGDRKEDTLLQFCISGFLSLQLICDRWFTSCLICPAHTLSADNNHS